MWEKEREMCHCCTTVWQFLLPGSPVYDEWPAKTQRPLRCRSASRKDASLGGTSRNRSDKQPRNELHNNAHKETYKVTGESVISVNSRNGTQSQYQGNQTDGPNVSPLMTDRPQKRKRTSSEKEFVLTGSCNCKACRVGQPCLTPEEMKLQPGIAFELSQGLEQRPHVQKLQLSPVSEGSQVEPPKKRQRRGRRQKVLGEEQGKAFEWVGVHAGMGRCLHCLEAVEESFEVWPSGEWLTTGCC